MKTLGIITEYNPFHQGHAYMLERAKRKCRCRPRGCHHERQLCAAGSLPFSINGQEPPPR